MRRLGLRGRMVLTAVAATTVALLAVLMLAEPGLRARTVAQSRDTLLAEARLVGYAVAELLAQDASPSVLDPRVDEAARDVRARITIVALDGRVVADSSLTVAEIAAVENHKERPEIREALGAGTGSAIRHSSTVGTELLYAAVAVRHQGRVVGFTRAAWPLESVDEQVAALRRAELIALAVGVVITGLLSAALSAPLATALKGIMEAARQFAAGNLSARVRAGRDDELGELSRILNRSVDLLQERLAENARDRARTDALLTSMEEGVLAVDHRGFVLTANQALVRGLELREPVGRHFMEVIRQRDVGEVIEAVLRTGERRALEVEIYHLRRVYAITGLPFPGDEGTPHGAILTFHDATERRRLDQIRRDFVANASHELRTPLTSIRGFVEALEDGAVQDPATSERFLGKIRTHADRMATLIEDLLELSRIESGDRPPDWEEVDPAEVAEDVVASFAALASRRGIALRVARVGAPRVVTDVERLRRILMNLVENAVKYTQEGGQVELAVTAGAEGAAILEVSDNGPGIALEHLPRIFERFYRVDKARSRELGGTGLGLSIAKHLAEGMGASVSVESEVGKGTRFRVVVPAGR